MSLLYDFCDFFSWKSLEESKKDCMSRFERQRILRRIGGKRIIKKFDDETAAYKYVLQEYRNYDHFGLLFNESGNVFKWRDTDYYGDAAWAKKIAKHYNCKIVEEEL